MALSGAEREVWPGPGRSVADGFSEAAGTYSTVYCKPNVPPSSVPGT